MAEPEQAGTPTPAATGSESAGTVAAAGADGSEGAGKPVDAALAMSWKEKAERVNAAEARVRELEARMADLDRRQYAPDPTVQALQSVYELAQAGDVASQVQLQQLAAVATQQKELELNDAMIEADVPRQYWQPVKALVRQSRYQWSVPQALAYARGSSEAPVLQESLKAKDEEIRKLREALDGRSAGGAGGKVSLSTPAAPAPETGTGPVEMDFDDYQAVLARGGPEAIALRNRGVKIRR